MKWIVTLKASREDAARLAAELPGELLPVADDPGKLTFELRDPGGGKTGEEASQAAKHAIESNVVRLNGLGRLRWGRSFRRVEIAGIATVDASGREGQTVFVDTAYAHLLPEEFAQAMVGLGHPKPEPPDGWEEIKGLNLEAVAGLATTAEEVAQVLQLVDLALEDDANLDWRLAYLAFELIGEDLHARGVEGQAIGLWTTSQRRLFTHTANSFGALGLRARHAKERTEPPLAPMTDQDAAWFLRRVTTRWIKHRLGEPLH